MGQVRSSDGTSIAYDRSGEGPALILVNGALSVRSAGGPLAALLAPRFSVFSYDRRGRGASGDTAPYAVEREIEDLAAVMAEAGGSAFVYGHSSGAVLSLRAAAHGLDILKLALYEPPFIGDDSRPLLPPDYVTTLAQLLAAGRRGEAVALFMTTAVEAPAEMVAQMRNGPMWPGLEAVAHTLPYDLAIMGATEGGHPSALARWAAVTVPTLVIDGGASPAWARNAVRALASTLPLAQQRTLDGQTHGADPKVLAPVLEEFLAG